MQKSMIFLVRIPKFQSPQKKCIHVGFSLNYQIKLNTLQWVKKKKKKKNYEWFTSLTDKSVYFPIINQLLKI